MSVPSLVCHSPCHAPVISSWDLSHSYSPSMPWVCGLCMDKGSKYPVDLTVGQNSARGLWSVWTSSFKIQQSKRKPNPNSLLQKISNIRKSRNNPPQIRHHLKSYFISLLPTIFALAPGVLSRKSQMGFNLSCRYSSRDIQRVTHWTTVSRLHLTRAAIIPQPHLTPRLCSDVHVSQRYV
jgi:hypothetical protein